MASYGWTLEEALGLTFPQMRVLYQANVKWPTANMLAAGIGHAMAEKDPVSSLQSMAGADVVKKMGKEEMANMLAKLGGAP